MKLKLNSNQLKTWGQGLLKIRGFLILAVIIGLLGYGGYLFSQIINLQPDPSYLSEQQQQLGQTKINFDKATITTINSLVQINPTVDLTNIGKSDPFSP